MDKLNCTIKSYHPMHEYNRIQSNAMERGLYNAARASKPKTTRKTLLTLGAIDPRAHACLFGAFWHCSIRVCIEFAGHTHF